MVVDFKDVDLKKRPTLILKNMDDRPIGALTHAIGLKMDIHLAEVSEITFDYPYQANGTVLPEFELLTGLRIIDVQGYGQFILRNPEETSDGVNRKKSCKAYSLEYEFSNDTITLEEGTYNFYNPVANSGSIMSFIMEKMPHWSVGTISENLVGKYRTFSADGVSLYDFMTNDLQQAYDCIFIFDTYDRTVSAISTADDVTIQPVYLSERNLIKQIEIEENTDDQTTVLDVYGADGVDIRSVNPMGENRLYNLDAYMNTSYFDQSIIDKWNAWKEAFSDSQDSYFVLVMRMQSKVAQLSTEQAMLNELNGEMKGLESKLAVLLQGYAIDPTDAHQDEIDACNAEIGAKKTEITAKESDISSIESDIATIQGDLADINEYVSFTSASRVDAFTDEELLVLRRYFKVGSLTDSTFVVSDYGSYSSPSVSSDLTDSDSTLTITDAKVDSVTDDSTVFYTVHGGSVTTWCGDSLTNDAATVSGKYLDDNGDAADSSYSAYIDYMPVESNSTYMLTCDWTASSNVRYLKVMEYDSSDTFLRRSKRVSLNTTDPSGTFSTGSGTAKIRISIGDVGCVSNLNVYPSTTAEIIKGTLQTDPGAQDEGNTFMLSLYLNGGMTDGSTEFGPGTLTISGTFDSITATDTGVSMNTTSSQLYLTHEITDYQKYSVAWELYDYAVAAMERLAYPTYHFSVESANFLVLDEFYNFAQNFKIGDRIYLHLPDGVISPVVIGASIDFDDPSAFSIEFSDSYTTNDKSFSLESLLDKAVSMGHNLDLQQYNYSSFVNSGANTSVKQFMDSAIDTMKNNIISGTGNEITIDQTGIRARKNENGTYSDKQLWISNNSIMLTKDAWDHAEVGIGEFKDNSPDAASGATVYGIAAPLLVGRILTGNNLIIESEKKDGGVSVFKVDSEGASLHNAAFNLYGATGGRLELDPTIGFAGGGNKDELLHYTDGSVDGILAADGSSITSVADISTSSLSTTPKNLSFWIDMNGGAYFAGKIMATSGTFGGWTLDTNQLYSGSGTTYVALNSSASSASNYAIWAGAESAASAPFSVKRDGTIIAKNGEFGDIQVETVTDPGTQTTTTTTSLVNPIYVGSGGCVRSGAVQTVSGTRYNFEVDDQGNLTLYGNLTMPLNGKITWGSGSAPGVAEADAIANGDYSGGTFIDGKKIYSPEIYAQSFTVVSDQDSGTTDGGFYLYDSSNNERLAIHYYDTTGSQAVPTIQFTGKNGTHATWLFDSTMFSKVCSFYGTTNFSSGGSVNCEVTPTFYNGATFAGGGSSTTYGSIITNGTSQTNNRGIQMQYDGTHYVKASESGAAMYAGGNQIYVNSSGATVVGGLNVNGGLTVARGSTITNLEVVIGTARYPVTAVSA